MKLDFIDDCSFSLVSETEQDKRTLRQLSQFHDEFHSFYPAGSVFTLSGQMTLPVTDGIDKSLERLTYKIRTA